MARPSLLQPSRETVRNLVSCSINMTCLMEGCSARKWTFLLGHSQIKMLPDSAATMYLKDGQEKCQRRGSLGVNGIGAHLPSVVITAWVTIAPSAL